MHKPTTAIVLTALWVCALTAPAEAKTKRGSPESEAPAPAVAPTSAPAAEADVETYTPAAASNGLSFSIARTAASTAGLGLLPSGGTGPDPNVGAGLTPGVAARLGYRIENLVVFGLFDLGRFSASDDKGNCLESDSTYQDNCKTWESLSLSVTALSIGAGARFLLDSPAAGLVTPYATASVFATIPMLGSSSDAVQEVLDAIAPGVGFGFTAGGGAEYFFSDALSVGGEAGLQFATMSFSDGTQGSSALQFFTSVLLNFYL